MGTPGPAIRLEGYFTATNIPRIRRVIRCIGEQWVCETLANVGFWEDHAVEGDPAHPCTFVLEQAQHHFERWHVERVCNSVNAFPHPLGVGGRVDQGHLVPVGVTSRARVKLSIGPTSTLM